MAYKVRNINVKSFTSQSKFDRQILVLFRHTRTATPTVSVTRTMHSGVPLRVLEVGPTIAKMSNSAPSPRDFYEVASSCGRRNIKLCCWIRQHCAANNSTNNRKSARHFIQFLKRLNLIASLGHWSPKFDNQNLI